MNSQSSNENILLNKLNQGSDSASLEAIQEKKLAVIQEDAAENKKAVVPKDPLGRL